MILGQVWGGVYHVKTGLIAGVRFLRKRPKGSDYTALIFRFFASFFFRFLELFTNAIVLPLIVFQTKKKKTKKAKRRISVV